jgi:hypothetical protein
MTYRHDLVSGDGLAFKAFESCGHVVNMKVLLLERQGHKKCLDKEHFCMLDIPPFCQCERDNITLGPRTRYSHRSDIALSVIDPSSCFSADFKPTNR